MKTSCAPGAIAESFLLEEADHKLPPAVNAIEDFGVAQGSVVVTAPHRARVRCLDAAL
jgi:hypothetical protein